MAQFKRPQFKRQWQVVDGVLLLDKPVGITSNDALQKVRRLFSAEKGGHTGTLDPMASGLLPLCFGEATKFSSDLLDADKTYTTTLRLGVKTDTGDADVVVVQTRPVSASESEIAEAVARFAGPQRQVPPMHSALKRDGVPLYRLAREGVVVEREARDIVIHRIELLRAELPEIELRVRCSKGTYIRVLGEDIGEALGCGAHLIALRREGVADLTLDRSVSLDSLNAADDASRLDWLLPVDSLLQSLPRLDLDPASALRFGNGNPVVRPGAIPGRVRVYADGRLVGLGRAESDDTVHPVRLIRRLTN